MFCAVCVVVIDVLLLLLLCCSEPLGGIIEGLSAGMFLTGMMIAVIALLIYRQRVRKV